ncbi:uncharacterized protein LOC107980967 [Nasonia vitripennis]|uniref:Uncharacterized protein n=1 Tax=Nasonia vitripennis TaxID=7425 RepID=A0A7M7M233_NASVI|nr:uncharacterized protein LOC107980967 [Nasonia vitripennis]XP_031782181.1 uncharacterized protein LOC107980967 [Nasonia vitripennis]
MMKYLYSNVSFTCILILMYAIVANINAQNNCNQSTCEQFCGIMKLNGTCRQNECDCILGKCNVIFEKTCEYICKKVELKGECNKDGYCICKAELELCYPSDCEQQCMEDVRAKQCMAQGGFVVPGFCMKYGPIKMCTCICNLPGKKNKFSVPLRNHSMFSTIYNAKEVIQI